MSLLRPRTRLVNFRLSEQEYQALKSVCEQGRARCLSDLARRAALECARAEAGPVESSLISLERRLAEVEETLRRMVSLLERTGRVGTGLRPVPPPKGRAAGDRPEVCRHLEE